MENLIQRITAWAPTMAEYHSGAEISSGFLGDVASEGLSAALFARMNGQSITTDRRMGRGTLLHKWFSSDAGAAIAVAPPDVRARRGKKWALAVAAAEAKGASAIVTAEDKNLCLLSWYSLLALPPFEDTPAKAQIRFMLKTWSPRFAEVSHRWEPLPGAACRLREDWIGRAPSGGWGTIQLKTTEASIATWWSYWRRYVRRASAFYRAGLRNLFGETPFAQHLVVARLAPPFPWAIFSLEDRADELSEIWHGEVLHMIEWISETLARGEMHGPEEKGLAL